ncbi:sporulation initiation factor Spo0A C-terminal domain-containing protein (plasmid) [Ureibacillus chungkukjangi]|uniref:sporulation initiation factor Spo0A C-terminal domain-containing protein n=1 Tax=Ureibacillus chungkukjangi TaxID=1202712 RepID=UPI00187D4323|nr:sporulation initiation factor Spo0A C-terminal domain-containing protein [Ureibacillus chungkukjangi]MCM3390421.1 sporulation initiation factor Spo0A C-terminal domain-containing protein [Ureibacillus chungkukjangi]HCG4536280.1 sporulation initiation factor Spo0A C-terminal domain-containing protein [Salmonella enterica subsp. enterica serovar Typhi str. AG3]
MNLTKETQQKLEKTIERIDKALEYNDREYLIELMHDLTEFAYFSGYKAAELNQQPKKINNDNNQETEQIPTLKPKSALEKRIKNLMLELGIPPHTKGYRYLLEAIVITHSNPDVIEHVTKIIYPTIAENNSTTVSRVQRAIRHSIEVSWKRGSRELLKQILGCPIDQIIYKPENSTFIYQFAEYLINNPEELE